MKRDTITAVVVEALPNYNFKIKLDDGNEIRAYVSGRMRLFNIRILPGDKVELELPKGSKIGRIVYRK